MTRQRAPAEGSEGLVGQPRPKFTSRAAVLVVVVCAIALSLAYPVREYIAQLRQIDQLRAEQSQLAARLKQLRAEHRDLSSKAYVEQQARDRLHMCLPTQTCYVIISGTTHRPKSAATHLVVTPWYERLWTSVRQADGGTSS
ncbi:MAG TPA: septum formation initiator family protein [Streptosporangiaceae bacterium]